MRRCYRLPRLTTLVVLSMLTAMTPASTIVIGHRFRGPPRSGNGGYSCGSVARFVEGPAEVTLRLPPPLDVPLEVEVSGGAVTVHGPDGVVAEAAPADVSAALVAEPPASPHPDEAAAASKGYPGFVSHPFPGCFVCGIDREPGDGLGIHPGPARNRELLACTWTAAPRDHEDGAVRPEIVWAALDCPSGWAIGQRHGIDAPMVLGRMSAMLLTPVAAGRPHVVGGWPVGREGRKLYGGSAVWTAEGHLCAVARSTWIVPAGS